jgi:hypothetical protein
MKKKPSLFNFTVNLGTLLILERIEHPYWNAISEPGEQKTVIKGFKLADAASLFFVLSDPKKAHAALDKDRLAFDAAAFDAFSAVEMETPVEDFLNSLVLAANEALATLGK